MSSTAPARKSFVRKREPLLYVGPLSHRIYLANAYKEYEDGLVEVTGSKVDVTSQVGRVIAELDALGLQLNPVETPAQTEEVG